MNTKLMTWANSQVGESAAKGFTVATPIYEHHLQVGVEEQIVGTEVETGNEDWSQQAVAEEIVRLGKDMVSDRALAYRITDAAVAEVVVLKTQGRLISSMHLDVIPAGYSVQLAPVESVCPITGMSEARANELSRAMVDALENVNPRGQRYVRA